MNIYQEVVSIEDHATRSALSARVHLTHCLEGDSDMEQLRGEFARAERWSRIAKLWRELLETLRETSVGTNDEQIVRLFREKLCAQYFKKDESQRTTNPVLIVLKRLSELTANNVNVD